METVDERLTALRSSAAADVQAALATLGASWERPYYDADADAAAVSAYYADTPAEQVALLITTTHRYRPRHNPAREVYPWVDLHPDHTLRSLSPGRPSIRPS